MMKGLQCNEFPGGIRLIQSLVPYSKCCKGFAVGFCSIKGLLASISGGSHTVHPQPKCWGTERATVGTAGSSF